MKKTLLEIINDLLDENGLDKVEKLNDTDHLMNDFGFDSLTLAQLTVIIEDEYGVDVFEKKVITTIGEIKEQIDE
jgi:acyl carrier protein